MSMIKPGDGIVIFQTPLLTVSEASLRDIPKPRIVKLQFRRPTEKKLACRPVPASAWFRLLNWRKAPALIENRPGTPKLGRLS